MNRDLETKLLYFLIQAIIVHLKIDWDDLEDTMDLFDINLGTRDQLKQIVDDLDTKALKDLKKEKE